MAWNEPGNNGNDNDPWGGGRRGSDQGPPDIDEVIKKLSKKLNGLFGGPRSGSGGGSGGSSKPGLSGGLLAGVVALALVVWGFLGVYIVDEAERGVVLRFGEWVRTSPPGLHYHLPFPIESVLRPEVTRDNRIEIGFRDVTGNSSSRRDIKDESQMITGDENIVDIDFVVFWRISDAGEYLFNLAEPDDTIKVTAEAVMREIIGRTPIKNVLTEGRQSIQVQARQQLQDLLNEYGVGVRVRDVQLLAVDPPADVIDAFNEVQRARQDRDRLRNEAEAYANSVVPVARGEAERDIKLAEAYREQQIQEAQGEADRFISVFEAYEVAPEVTRRRMYLETLGEVLGSARKVIIDQKGGASGVVPYLPLPEVQKRLEQDNRDPGN